MKTGLYQIIDFTAGMIVSPIIGFPRQEAAVRWFQQVASDERSDVCKYPEDHGLLYLGEQSIESGTIEPQLVPRCVYDGQIMAKDIQDRQAAAAARDANGGTTRALQAGAEQTPIPAAHDVERLPAPTAEELSCVRCRKHYTMHVNNGLCPDNSGARFQPTQALQAHYKDYLDSRAQQQ